MTREEAGRMIITCDRCNSRLDLGPVRPHHLPRRAPSGWLSTGDNSHLCGLCSPGYTARFIRRFG